MLCSIGTRLSHSSFKRIRCGQMRHAITSCEVGVMESMRAGRIVALAEGGGVVVLDE